MRFNKGGKAHFNDMSHPLRAMHVPFPGLLALYILDLVELLIHRVRCYLANIF